MVIKIFDEDVGKFGRYRLKKCFFVFEMLINLYLIGGIMSRKNLTGIPIKVL